MSLQFRLKSLLLNEVVGILLFATFSPVEHLDHLLSVFISLEQKLVHNEPKSGILDLSKVDEGVKITKTGKYSLVELMDGVVTSLVRHHTRGRTRPLGLESIHTFRELHAILLLNCV